MKLPVAFATVLLSLPMQAPLQAQTPTNLKDFFPSDAKLEELASGFTWTEGPVQLPSGAVLFAEIPSNSIRVWNGTAGQSQIWLKPSGATDQFHGKEPGSNGMTLDANGRVSVAGHGRRNVWRVEGTDPHSPQTALAESYEGKRLNSPNDLVYARDGSLYFTDPPYGLESQGDDDPKKELKFNGVYRIANATSLAAGAKPQEPQLIIRDLTRPNGIAISPDGKVLYVAVSDPAHKVWMRYPLKQDGTVGQGSMLLDCTNDPAKGSPDGIKVDRKGNIFGSGPGGVWVISPSGKHLGTLPIPQPVANLNWGHDGYLYITASASLYRIRTTAIPSGQMLGR